MPCNCADSRLRNVSDDMALICALESPLNCALVMLDNCLDVSTANTLVGNVANCALVNPANCVEVSASVSAVGLMVRKLFRPGNACVDNDLITSVVNALALVRPSALICPLVMAATCLLLKVLITAADNAPKFSVVKARTASVLRACSCAELSESTCAAVIF